ncbi:hypothetical protein [Winogradskyella ursingii]|uniref:hypothetical protein n=1 Tax=Winogradskyella ursingii TaxID=2686079 RepID=UPI0015CEADF3|nr:hypothetical protein [Winogradskyella ursingii]
MIITPFLVIFMIVVFVLLFLFLNTVDKRKWLTALISLVLTPFVYFYVFYPFVNIVSNYHHQKYFNSETWKEQPSLRYEMIDNTIESDTLIGMSKEQIKNQLGQYEWLSWNPFTNSHDNKKWNYALGIEPGAFNSEKECVELTFKNDIVVQLKHYQDAISYDEKE